MHGFKSGLQVGNLLEVAQFSVGKKIIRDKINKQFHFSL